MSKRRKKGRNKFPFFGLFMVLYVIVGVIVSFVLWGKLSSYAEDYERSLPKYGMDEVMAAASAGNIADLITEQSLVTDAKYEGLEEYRKVLTEKLSGHEVTMQEAKEATKEVPRYVLLADGAAVTDVSLKVVGKNDHDMDVWGFDKFYPDKYNITDTVYEVTVPDNCTVIVNGFTLGEDAIALDENGEKRITQIKDLDAVKDYLDEVPYYITYQVSGFLMEPVVAAMSGEEHMVLTRDGNSFSADLPYYADAAAEVEALIPTVMEAYGKHFIGINSGGVYQYLLPDSQYKEDVKTVVTYFYPTSRITSHTFENKSCDSFVTYSENCVACHIYFDLIVRFNSAAYKTKNEGSDATWIFVKRDGTWYLAQVLRQKSIEYAGD